MYLKKEVFLIVGLAKSGFSCGKFLLQNNAKCYFYEDNLSVLSSNVAQIKQLGGVIVEKEKLDEVLNEITVLVLSPGVPIDNVIAKKVRNLGKRIIGELELGAEFINSPIIAITGTNGKTTTTYLLEHLINKSGVLAYAVGNVGIPITSMIGSVGLESNLIAEVSSFQLETCNRFLPHIAVILNITPDHLGRHYTMENYVYLKGKLLKNLRENEFAVLNFDDKIVKEMATKTRAKVVYFSLTEKIDGAYLLGDKIYYNNQEIMSVDQLSIKGKHNVSNALASVAVCKILGIENSVICEGLSTFKGAKHRIEYVKEINGISFYNDSKSTNPDSTVKAVGAMEKSTVLLLGGKQKEVDYKQMFTVIKTTEMISEIVLFGEARYYLYEVAKNLGLNNLHLTKMLSDAVKLAYGVAPKNSNVLLSPACSSYDNFANYEERGEEFISVVNNLI